MVLAGANEAADRANPSAAGTAALIVVEGRVPAKEAS
jgi:hypothetical protein